MIYFDSSYLVRLYVRDAHSDHVRKLLSSGEVVSSSIHGKSELFSALHRGFRERLYTSVQLAKIIDQIHLDSHQENLFWFPITAKTVDLTESVYRKAPAHCFLRAADALHLACARENGFKIIYSNDKRLLESAPLFGLKGKNVI